MTQPRSPIQPRLPALPRLLLLTDRRSVPRPLVEVVAAAVHGGVRAVVLREKDLPVDARAALAAALRVILAPVDGLLILAGTSLSGPAAHLATGDPPPVPRPRLLGRSCHNAADVTLAAAQGMDYVTVSPVHPSASKPGYGPPLGAAGLTALTRVPDAPPVFALGGVTAGNARSWLAAGAAGVAVMGVVMRSDHPDRCVRELLAALPPAAPGRSWTDPPAPAKENPCPPHR